MKEIRVGLEYEEVDVVVSLTGDAVLDIISGDTEELIDALREASRRSYTVQYDVPVMVTVELAFEASTEDEAEEKAEELVAELGNAIWVDAGLLDLHGSPDVAGADDAEILDTAVLDIDITHGSPEPA